MKVKKIGLMMSAVAVAIGLVGCQSTNLPEGDVKIVNQQVSGVIGLLLESADYGPETKYSCFNGFTNRISL